MPKSLYSNRLVSQAAVMHYIHGLPLKRIIEVFGREVTQGGLIGAFHRLGRMAEAAQASLLTDFRQSAVKHADETSWRTDGKSGYAWIFCSANTSIFRFRDSRAGKVAHEIFGNEPLPGTLVVDRYAAYNRAPCKLQYCLAHILRDVEKLEDEFPDSSEVKKFVAELAPALAEAMRLRNQEITDKQYLRRAGELHEKIMALANKSAHHEGVRQIQRIFIEKHERLFEWASNRAVPAENNAAERELRPTVIARKTSFGSQSEKGAKTRSNLMSLLHTVKMRIGDQSVEDWLAQQLALISHSPRGEQQIKVPPFDASRSLH
jgi:transposase